MNPEPRKDNDIGSEQYGISSLSTSNPQHGHVSTNWYYYGILLFVVLLISFFFSVAVLLDKACFLANSQLHGMLRGW